MMPRVMQRFKALNSDRIAAILFAVAVGFAIWLYGVLAHRNDLFPYPQLHGEFTPFVSALDLVANCGRAGRQYIHSKTVNWKEFVHGSW